MRYFLLVFGLTVLSVMFIAGKRGDLSRRPPIEIFPDMDRQPKLRPQAANSFFKSGVSSQNNPPGTVARGSAYEDNAINTGIIPGTTNWVENIPVPVTATLMARGQERYSIHCTPCHGPQGDGKGITVKLGMSVIADLHDSSTRKIVQMPDGQIFNTITYGKNLMGPYAASLTVEDRWAVVAYVRALQRSHLGLIDDVPAGERASLPKTSAATPGK